MVSKTLKMLELLENRIAPVPNLAFVDIASRQSALVARLLVHCIFSIPPSLLDTHSSSPSINRMSWRCF